MTGHDQLRPSTELAIKYLIDSRHPQVGGWKHRPSNQRVTSVDISVMAQALVGLHTAWIAGIPLPRKNFEAL